MVETGKESGEPNWDEHSAESVGRRIRDAVEREPQADDEQDLTVPGEQDSGPVAEAPPDPLQEAHKAYLDALVKVFGGLEQLNPCPVCRTLGFVEAGLEADPGTETCPVCNGAGKLLTRSKVQGQVERQCGACSGQGFRELPKTPEQLAAAPYQPPAPYVPRVPDYVPPPAGQAA